MFAVARNAFADLGTGFRMHRVWLALAQEDIDEQHRRTTLGPIWMLLNYLIYIITFMMVFGRATIPNFIAYFSVGMLVFMFLQEIMTRSVGLFRQERAFIAGTTMPLTVYVMRMAMQSVIRTSYAVLGCFAVLLVSGTPMTMAWIWSIAGLIEALLVTVPTIILFAMAGAYFPDMQFIITNLIRVSMFLTPIFWVKAPGARENLSRFNPLTYFLDTVRDPIVFGTVPVHAFIVCAVIIAATWLLAIVLLGKYRRDIVFLL